MTNLTNSEGSPMTQISKAWTLADAKAEEWNRKMQRQGTLADFFAGSPLRDSGLDLERPKDSPRDIDL